jgi:hypothetical protein
MHVACKLHLSRCSARGIFLPRCKILGGGCLPVTCTLDSGPRVFMIQFYMPSCMPSRVCFSHSIPRSRHVSYWAEIPTCILHQSPFFMVAYFRVGPPRASKFKGPCNYALAAPAKKTGTQERYTFVLALHSSCWRTEG